MKTAFRPGLLTAVGLLFLSILPGLAQRQTPGRPSLDGYVTLNQKFSPAGGGFFWCNYDFRGRTHLGLDVFREGHSFHEDAVMNNGVEVAPAVDYSFMATDVNASIGYLFRLLAPRSRTVILSAGGHLLGGVKYVPEMSGFTKSNGKNYAQVGAYIGIVPELQFEVFPFRNVSIYISARPRLRILSTIGGKDAGWFLMSESAGFKVYM